MGIGLRTVAVLAAGFATVGVGVAACSLTSTGTLLGDAAPPPNDRTPPPPDGPPCSSPLTLCGVQCVNLQTDTKNCGTCGTDCTTTVGPLAGCSAGKCIDCSNVDFMTDGKNCGSCGHDCLGGNCLAGKCAPAVVVSTPGVAAFAVGVEGDYLYWTAQAQAGPVATSGVYRVPRLLTGSDAGTVLVGFQALPFDLSIASGRVYYSGLGGSFSVPTDGGAGQYIAPGNWSMGIHASDAGVFWTNYFATHPGLVHSDLDGGNVQAVVTSSPSSHGVVSDGTQVFWVGASDVMRADLDGGNATVLATPIAGRNGQLAGIRVLTADATHVYWSDPSVTAGAANGRILKIAKDGSQDAGSPTVLASSQADPRYVAVDATHVYWTNFGTTANTGQIVRAKKDGTGLEVLASGLDSPIGIAVDATAIYVATSGYPGTILRLAKP